MRETIEKQFVIDNLSCSSCAVKIENGIKSLDYVKNASLNFSTKNLRIETYADESYNTLEQIKNVIKDIEPGVNVFEKSKQNKTKETAETDKKKIIEAAKLITGTIIFLIALLFKFPGYLEFSLYLISYLLTGFEVLIRAFKNIIRGKIFDENFLMAVATAGAFAVKQFPEGAAVMLFYKTGEYLQNIAVNSSRKSIASLMEIRPEYANLKQGREIIKAAPEEVHIGDVILIKPGERVPLDGLVIKGNSVADTSALSGESMPREMTPGSEILSGFVNINGLLTVRVTKEYGNSTVSKIIELVEKSSDRKAPTENFIKKFASIYTPVVVGLAFLLAFIPPLVLQDSSFSIWIYRALILLVISCPCALMISIPLGFFGGIGAASRNGILIKGGNYLEALNYVETVVFDKTGTLTKGIFTVTSAVPAKSVEVDELLELAAYCESFSEHPVASSIVKAFGKNINRELISEHEEILGFGSKIIITGKRIIAGNSKLMQKYNISYAEADFIGSVVHVAVDKEYKGYIIVSDELKKDSKETIKKLKEKGIKKIFMLTGDNARTGQLIGKELGIDDVYCELLPDQKVEKLEYLEKEKSPKGKIVFVGDGINDAPVLARADIGVAMGGLGSDAAIESADVVIMNDEPLKLVSAINIARSTKRVIWQNILLALGVKIIVIAFGTFGIATMWSAVFADVGVTIIAVLNATRLLKIKNN
jgi:Cd2+/Zn2+-exporting ATPase